MKINKFHTFIKEAYSDGELHYYAFDWDDNILHMPTVIHMDKLIDGEWNEVDVSTSEFAKVRNDRDNYRLRNNDPVQAFCEFRDSGPRGDESFMIDSEEAIENGKMGPSWDAFIECLVGGNLFAIITARGHEPETIRKGVEMVINDCLDEDQKFEMYNNCLMHSNFFTRQSVDSFERIPKGKVTETDLIKTYLDECSFFGVSSTSFAEEFGGSSAQNPEKAKEMALEYFVDKCNKLGKSIGAKSVSVGFSDDDPKNVDHVDKFFKEKSALSHGLTMKLSVYNTNDPTLKGGERTRYIGESSHRAPGMDSSVMPFSKWTSQSQWLNTNSKHSQDAYINQMYNQTKLVTDLTKMDTTKPTYKRRKIKKKNEKY